MDPKTLKVWDIETRSGLQVIDGNYHPSLYSGVASIAFSSDSKTLIIVACDSTATFWKWTEDKPYLYGSKGMGYFCDTLYCALVPILLSSAYIICSLAPPSRDVS